MWFDGFNCKVRMKKSTSIHNIDGSSKLAFLNRILYLILNIANNSFSKHNVDTRLQYSNFIPNDIEPILATIDQKRSPSRMLSYLLWYNVFWENVRQQLGGQINLLDIGCGKGIYSCILNDFSGGNIDTYHGIDISESQIWERLRSKSQKVRFTRYDGRDLSFGLTHGVNMIISQSALEHVEEDLFLFHQIARHIKEKGTPMLQIHLFPSPACLLLYLTHGIRQYTPRTISKITRLFGEESRFILLGMGGVNCFKLHWKAITRPRFFGETSKNNSREKDPQYSLKLYDAIRADCRDEKNKLPNFYALMISSNCKDIEWSSMESCGL